MIEPKKIYDGIHSILRNILPGLIILSPLLISSDTNIKDIHWVILLTVYLIATVISHSLVEGIGYSYLNRSIKKQGLNKICKDIFLCLFVPSYFIYRDSLICRINEKVKDFGIIKPLSFEEYRSIQDNQKVQLFLGDHDYIHRINSFMLCFDISCIGLFLLLLSVGLMWLLSFFNIDLIKRFFMHVNQGEMMIAITVFYFSFTSIRFFLRKNLLKFEFETLFSEKNDWKYIIYNYRRQLREFPFISQPVQDMNRNMKI
jgi:hypothetical protein